ncbi:hypothetical protein ACFVTX_13880 [Agromyces sp. NPDC058136]|uniref:alginate O-acetyltransferase AlgX-related protein n=1 Tax=Agromyces sp. NPDC058136 TaxID=3346354 RepID=UPI0036DF0092
MSLRELPPEQRIDRSRDRWRRIRYIPLIALVVVAMILTVVGYSVVQRQAEAALAAAEEAAATATDAPSLPPVDYAQAAAVGPLPAETVTALPEQCHPDVAAPPTEPWLGGDPAAAESTWQAHAAELAEGVVLGEDGWVFWGDIQNQNFSQAVGRRVLSEEETAQWADHLRSVRDMLSAQGIPLYIMVTPAKWSVYPENLPAWAREIRGSGPLDQLIHAAPDLPIIDSRTQLREASVQHQTFSRVNSHWTDYGAYMAWASAASCIGTVNPELGDLAPPTLAGVEAPVDYNEFASYGFANTVPDWTTPVFTKSLPPVTVTSTAGTSSLPGNQGIDLTLLPATTENPAAATDGSALILRDSFGNGLSPYWQQAFTTTWQYRHNYDDPANLPDIAALVSEHRPDVVILQIAQRHLNIAPPADE